MAFWRLPFLTNLGRALAASKAKACFFAAVAPHPHPLAILVRSLASVGPTSEARRHLEPKFKPGRGRVLGIETAQLVAENRGGKCLSTAYVSCTERLLWRCSEGHSWFATLNNVKNLGTWCPTCHRDRRSGATGPRVASDSGKKKSSPERALWKQACLEEAHKIANARGGRCLSSTFLTVDTKLELGCHAGHRWSSLFSNVKYKKAWCPQCRNEALKGVRLTMAHAHEAAERFGGRCLSEQFSSVDDILLWRCHNGHEFESKLATVRHSKQWCQACRHDKRRNTMLSRAHAAAANYGGKCLSSEYQHGQELLKWQCREGHEWERSWTDVKAGSWCPECSMTSGEQQVKSALERIFLGHRFHKVFPKFLKPEGQKRGLQLDGYCPDLNLAFEYNGEQHYNPKCFYNADPRSLDSFEARVRRDQLKLELCEKAGIFLIVVPHFATDVWLCVRLQLMKWFSMAQIFPAAIGE